MKNRIKRFIINHVSPKIWRKFANLAREDYSKDELEIWEKYYPKGKGKYIVDIGSDKESMKFFYGHGAKKVYCIGDYFNSHVSDGGIKIDIEGAERGMIIETHYKNPKLVLLHEFENGVKLWRLD